MLKKPDEIDIADMVRKVISEEWLRKKAVKLFGSAKQSRRDHEDLFQRVCLKGLQNAEQIRNANLYTVRSWLEQIMVRTHIDDFRKELVNKEVAIDEEVLLNQQSSKVNPEEEATFSQLKERILDYISGLPSAHRDVIRLKFFESMEVAEICEEVSLKKTQVYMIIKQARPSLKELVNNL